MPATKADIILQLKKDILALQGFKTLANNEQSVAGLGPINEAFPNSVFPLGAVHEFICEKTEDVSASTGFITGILSSLMEKAGVSVWISSSPVIFPPSLKAFGVSPDKMIFIHLPKENDILWTIEEALKCEGLAAVIGELPKISFTESRRLQLAVERSRVTGFILCHHNRNTTACVTRWKISHCPSLEADMPGVGFPRWNVELSKVRNGKPGSWQVEWVAGRFRHMPVITPVLGAQHKKTG